MRHARARSSAIAGAAGLLACLLAPAAAGDPGSPPKSLATLTVTYEFKGGGDDIPASHERHVKWSVNDRYEVKAQIAAQTMSPVGGLHKTDPKIQADLADRQSAAAAAEKNMAPMMAQAQAMMAKCGQDQACLQREAMKMAQGVNPNAQELKDAKSGMQKAGAPMANRYQMFMAGKQSGEYRIDESAHEAYFDAACGLKTESRCAFDTTVKGAGAVTDGKTPTFDTGAHAEIDYQTGSLMLVLPWPGFAKATKTVTSQNKDIKTGASDVSRKVYLSGALEEAVEVKCGECKAASGTLTKQIKDDLLGRQGTLVVTWKFTRP